MNRFFIIWMILLSFTSIAQKMTRKDSDHSKYVKPLPVTLMEGSLKLLDTISTINIKFVYDSMIIGKDTPEEKFVAQRIINWNEKKSGKGDEWRKYWYSNRILYESAFRNSFYTSSHIKSRNQKDKYTLILKTKRTDIGWNTGMLYRGASIDAEVWIVESDDHSKALAKIQLFDIRGKNGNGGDFEMGLRIVEAYSKAGEVLGVFLN